MLLKMSEITFFCCLLLGNGSIFFSHVPVYKLVDEGRKVR